MEQTGEQIVLEEERLHENELAKTMQARAWTTRVQAGINLTAEIQKMINNPDCSDIVFRCKDGAQVHANRYFLVARSEVFHRMLLNGMAESQLSEITLHEITSTALLPVMEFLYSRILEEHTPKDWKNAYEIIGASRFFLLKDLELIVMDYLHLAVAKVEADIEAAAKFLSVTVEFIDLLGESVELIACDLVSILEPVSFNPEHLQAFTDHAFLYFLQATKIDKREPNAEFLRLSNIILRCACKEFIPQIPLVLNIVPPEITSTIQLLQKPPVQQEDYCPQSEVFKKIRSRLADSVGKYLHFVNFQRIPAQFLAHVIEPMDIIPCHNIMDSFRFHALRTPHNTKMGIPSWSTSSKIYRTGRGGYVIQQTASGSGSARYNLVINPNNKFDGIYKWEIIIEKDCADYIEIGLQADLYGTFIPHDGCSLSQQPGGWALRMDSQGLFINRKGKHQDYCGDPNFIPYGKDCSQLIYRKHYGHKKSKVKVCVNVFLGKCSFIIDNENFGTAWTDISGGSLSPAVSLGTEFGGRVRIRIIR